MKYAIAKSDAFSLCAKIVIKGCNQSLFESKKAAIEFLNNYKKENPISSQGAIFKIVSFNFK